MNPCRTCGGDDRYPSGKCRPCHREARRRWRNGTPGGKASRNRDSMNNGRRARRFVVEAYGGVCACCGESEFVFLDLDHVNGGGAAHRSRYPNTGKYWCALRRQVKESGLSPDYRVLCANCNAAMHRQGSCPHSLALVRAVGG